MKKLLKTLPATVQNLALDEWLLHRCDSSNVPVEVLRLWENPVHAVILGRSSKVMDEVNQEFCRAHNIEYLRRSSGGASVVIGPGCLMYAVVLDYRIRPELKMLDQAHQYVMQKMLNAIQQCGVNVRFQGTCDLTLDGRKFSGNSLRCQRNSFLYHGTLLYDFDLNLVQQCLGTPPRQPEYREGRSHQDFVTNLPVSKEQLVTALVSSWNAHEDPANIPMDQIETLVREKYGQQAWTHKR